ncbi:MAG: OmpA family protein [Rhodospirillaceae bacterium]|nr:OmpA family protein [Rhodospirillaceae bacterium]
MLGVVTALGLLAGCSSDIEQVRNAQPTGGSDFTRALAEEYKQFALYEADTRYDWPDAGYFARKGLAAANGEVVLPEDLANWDIPAGMVDELSSSRSRLITVLDGGARDSNPVLAARAQARFDCWVENAEENHEPMAIQACRDEFLTALEQLEQPAQPAATPAPPAPEVYIVLFDFDRANIRPDGQQVINRVLADAKAKGTPQISVTGHADRAGPADYNLALSLRRADAVRQALIAGGISADQITVSGRGEEEPAVPTPDGVREQANRRVEIIIQ